MPFFCYYVQYYILVYEIEVNVKMDSTRKQFSKYLVELKKAKGKFLFFTDLSTVISKKKIKKLQNKLTELQNLISDVSQDAELYKKSIRSKLKEISSEKIPEKISEVIKKIQNELDGKVDNFDANLKNDEKINEKSIDENNEKEADLSQALDINRCLKKQTNIEETDVFKKQIH